MDRSLVLAYYAEVFPRLSRSTRPTTRLPSEQNARLCRPLYWRNREPANRL